MNAWVWVVIILWLLFMATYAWGMCRMYADRAVDDKDEQR